MSEEETAADYEAAKGPFHDLRLHVVNLCSRIHKVNEKWWVDLRTGEPLKRNVGELLMLCVSELSEAMEGDRKDLADTHLSHRGRDAI